MFKITKQERKALSALAILIVLGIVGIWIL